MSPVVLEAPTHGQPPPPALAVGVPTSTTVLLILAIIAGVIGVLMLSEATSGVGLVCLGCLLAVLGRILQASEHHRDAMRRLGGGTLSIDKK